MEQERRSCILIFGLKGYQCRFYRSKETRTNTCSSLWITDQENPLPLRQKLGSFVAPVWLVWETIFSDQRRFLLLSSVFLFAVSSLLNHPNDQEFLNNEKAQSKSFENKAIFNNPCLFTSSLNLFVTARPHAKSFQMKGGHFIGISTGVWKEAIVILKGLLRDESFIRSLIGRKTRVTFSVN